MSLAQKAAEIMMAAGGAAFPLNIKHEDGSIYTDAGMTLRDYFAVRFMQGHVSNGNGYASPEALSTVAYKMADAMLEARK